MRRAPTDRRTNLYIPKNAAGTHCSVSRNLSCSRGVHNVVQYIGARKQFGTMTSTTVAVALVTTLFLQACKAGKSIYRCLLTY